MKVLVRSEIWRFLKEAVFSYTLFLLPFLNKVMILNIHYYTVLQTARAVLQWELCVVFYLGSSWLKAIAFVVSRWHQLQNQLCTLEEELHHQDLDSAES